MNELHVTKTGLEIGRNYTPPKPPQSADDDLIQAAFLRKDTTDSLMVDFAWRFAAGLLMAAVIALVVLV